MTALQVIAVIAAPLALALTVGVVAFVRPAPAPVPAARVANGRVSRWERRQREAHRRALNANLIARAR